MLEKNPASNPVDSPFPTSDGKADRKQEMANFIKPLSRARSLNLAAALICTGLVGCALYLQYFDSQDPCPLCIFQRVFYILSGMIFLLAALINPKSTGLRILAVLTFLSSLTGALVAGRQIWVQHLPPDQVPPCLPSLGSLFRYLPADQVISMVLKGSGDCAIVTWRLFGLSMPEWSLLFFILLSGISLANLVSCHEKQSRQDRA